MFVKKITSENYLTGEKITKEYRFAFTKPELMDLEYASDEKLSDKIKIIAKKEDEAAIYRIFKEMILKSYGEVSEDGTRFEKSEAISEAFSHTDAYSELYESMLTNSDAIIEFFEGILPKGFVNTKDFEAAKAAFLNDYSNK